MKIKVLKFKVSNWTSSSWDDDVKHSNYLSSLRELSTPQDIQKAVNSFCQNKDIIDIKVNNVDINYHNNARGNTVELWYTIIYKETKK